MILQQKQPPLIISAYSVHPLPHSAEAVVNAALLDVLSTDFQIGVVTSGFGYTPIQLPGKMEQPSIRVYAAGNFRANTLWERLNTWLVYPQWHPCGAIARFTDRVRLKTKQTPLNMHVWSEHAARQILSWLNRDFDQAVVWARGTPPESLEAAIVAFKKQPFPLVVNYNDPMPQSLLWGKQDQYSEFELLQFRQNRFLAQHAQAWTFPSYRLARMMADAEDLDLNRCFVIPHAVPNTDHCTNVQEELVESKIIYTGTFYSSLFFAAIQSGIVQYAQQGGKLRFVFVLKKPSIETRKWIQNEIPGALLYCDASPSDVTEQVKRAHAILLVDDALHGPLLRTKVVEAVCSGKPMIAFAPSQTTTHDVISAGGGIVIDPVDTESVVSGLFQSEALLQTWHVDGQAQTRAAKRFSGSRIKRDIASVMEYARHRYEWQQPGKAVTEPEIPDLERWP